MITRAFKLLDEEGDGELKLAEIKVGIDKYLKDYDTTQFTDDRIMKVIKMINIPNDGKEDTINYSQFCMAAINENVLVNKDKTKRLFHLFDFVLQTFSA